MEIIYCGRSVQLRAGQLLKAIVAVFLLLSTSTTAFAVGYECTVKGAYDVDKPGVLAKNKFGSSMVGSTFNVDRTSGRATGALQNFNASGEPKIIDPGSREQAFKVITVYGSLPAVDYLQIKEYVKSPKPFFFYNSIGFIFSGTCVDE